MGQALKMCVHCDHQRDCDICPDLHEWIIEHMNPSDGDYQRFLALRRRAMDVSMSAWSFCKTPLPAMIGDSEFRVAMVFPDCYRECEEGRSDKPCGFYIEQSYYSGDGWIKIRVWSGETFSEALDKFETDINK